MHFVVEQVTEYFKNLITYLAFNSLFIWDINFANRKSLSFPLIIHNRGPLSLFSLRQQDNEKSVPQIKPIVLWKVLIFKYTVPTSKRSSTLKKKCFYQRVREPLLALGKFMFKNPYLFKICPMTLSWGPTTGKTRSLGELWIQEEKNKMFLPTCYCSPVEKSRKMHQPFHDCKVYRIVSHWIPRRRTVEPAWGYSGEARQLLHFCLTDSKPDIDRLVQTTEECIPEPRMPPNNISPPSTVRPPSSEPPSVAGFDFFVWCCF